MDMSIIYVRRCIRLFAKLCSIDRVNDSSLTLFAALASDIIVILTKSNAIILAILYIEFGNVICYTVPVQYRKEADHGTRKI